MDKLLLLLPLALGLTSAALYCAPASAETTSTRTERLLTDFGLDAAVRWTTVNDNVMGGRSRGGFRTQNGVLLFTGSTNTNGGGFSSIRSRPLRMDLRGYEGVRVRVRADGRKYTFRLTTSTSSRGRYTPSYWADFETPRGQAWTSIDVPFSKFRPRWRGRMLNGPALDLGNIATLGLMIYDKRDGPFRIEVDSIHAYRTPPAFRLSSVQWKKRPLLVFAPSANDARLQRQLAAVDQVRSDFDARDMLLVVITPNALRVDGKLRAAAGAQELRRRFSVATEGFSVRLIGKDGTEKRASGEEVRLADLFTQIDGMPMRQDEMRASR